MVTGHVRRSIPLLALLALASCQRDLPTSVRVEPRQTKIDHAANSLDLRTRRHPSIPRVQAYLTAAGSFKPNAPVTVTLVALANRDARVTKVAVTHADRFEKSDAVARALHAWSGSLSIGDRHSRATAITFDEPGYYRIRATLTADDEQNIQSRSDTLVLSTSYATLWILISEEGGRLTNGFDATVIDEYGLPLYGSYGPFGVRGRSRALRRTIASDSVALSGPLKTRNTPLLNGDAASENAATHGPAPLSSFGSGATLTGTVRYNDYNVSLAARGRIAAGRATHAPRGCPGLARFREGTTTSRSQSYGEEERRRMRPQPPCAQLLGRVSLRRAGLRRHGPISVVGASCRSYGYAFTAPPRIWGGTRRRRVGARNATHCNSTTGC